MPLGQNLIVNEDVTVVDAAEHVLLGAIERISDKELAVGWPSDHLDLQQRHSRFAQSVPALLLVCDVQ